MNTIQFYDEDIHPADRAQIIERAIDAEIASWSFENDPIVKRFESKGLVIEIAESEERAQFDEAYRRRMNKIGAAVIARMYGSKEKMKAFKPYKPTSLEDMPF